MINKNKFIAITLAVAFTMGIFVLAPSLKPTPPPTSDKFEDILKEVQDFYKSEVGYDVQTPIKKFDYSKWSIQDANNVLAYCYLDPNDKYIAFNFPVIERTLFLTPNKDLVFQIILHEYTHCEGNVGHIQMYGHFQNDGGAPWLTKDQVKEQFRDFLSFYRKLYKKFPIYGRDEMDLDSLYALIIETDANGKIKIKCPCKSCIGG